MSKKCIKCGAMIADDAEFCPECGTKQAKEAAEGKPAERHCPYCGAKLSADAAFCGECGKPVGAGNQAVGNGQTAQGASPAGQQGTSAGNRSYQAAPQTEQSSPMPIKKLMIALIAVAVAVVGYFVYSMAGPPSISVKAKDMVNDYVRDQAGAEKKYKGKRIEITGTVIHKSQFTNTQNYNVTIAYRGVGGKDYSIVLDVDNKNVAKVNAVKVGDFVSAQGTCVGIVAQEEPTDISVQIKADKLNE
ncbi:MAG: zinc-ribbon domain-containing protein [Acidaminococcus sp.]|jgi:ribosomal protein L40E|nr:zinc-ribbon domain-containing protein [Acidaminococcus sp.]MCI2099744.1 zinc-ribbon domain-containing protein [Acidaminococcus sp.]MCI2113986.1 zinc-ribbon domain-containing protein [Acidaminococcus sp.]MCI2116095.1 zinc-ribbon domain-containing protein [Acidaminococcus sp.]